MSYQEILQDCLARLRAGAAIDDLVSQHPRHAAELRADLEAASAMGRVSNALPGEAASSRRGFQRALAAEQERRTKTRTPWMSLKLPALALGAAAALIVAMMLFGGLFDTKSAQAGTIEGVVVQSADGELTIQTEGGLETVAYETTTEVLDETGLPLNLVAVEPGQYVVIRGDRRSSGFAARRIEVAPLARLSAWCESFAEECANLERLLTAEESGCNRGPFTCENLRNRLDFLRSRIEQRSRLEMLRERCDSGTNPACREILQHCETNPGSCEPFRDWLRMRRQR